MAILQQIWLYEIIGDMLPMCQNTTMQVNGVWIKRYCVLCSKRYNPLHNCHNFPAGSLQADRVARICETRQLLTHSWTHEMMAPITQSLPVAQCSPTPSITLTLAQCSITPSLTLTQSLTLAQCSITPSLTSIKQPTPSDHSLKWLTTIIDACWAFFDLIIPWAFRLSMRFKESSQCLLYISDM